MPLKAQSAVSAWQVTPSKGCCLAQARHGCHGLAVRLSALISLKSHKSFMSVEGGRQWKGSHNGAQAGGLSLGRGPSPGSGFGTGPSAGGSSLLDEGCWASVCSSGEWGDTDSTRGAAVRAKGEAVCGVPGVASVGELTGVRRQ